MKPNPPASPHQPQLPGLPDDTTPEEALLEGLPETERWDPVPGSAGHQAPTNPSADEDAEGRSQKEQLVEDGMAEAEREEKLRAES